MGQRKEFGIEKCREKGLWFWVGGDGKEQSSWLAYIGEFWEGGFAF